MENGMFAGQWRNKAGDELHLVQCGASISGTYISARSEVAETCRSRILVGSINENTICFVAGASTPRIMKSWTGRLSMNDGSGHDEIKTVCHSLERLTDDFDIARSVQISFDLFQRA